MRYSYGSVDREKILAHKPQIFQRSEDLLIFPGRDFHKWYNEILELLEGIYQVNAKNLENGRYVKSDDLELAMGLLVNIDNYLMEFFNPRQKLDFEHHYISIMDEKFKNRQTNWYGRYMHKVDRKVVKITPQMRYRHMMEILDYAYRQWRNNESRY